MKNIEINEAINVLIKERLAELEDGDFVAEDMNELCGHDLFFYCDIDNVIRCDDEGINHIPHFAVEYDDNYCEGNYDKVGEFILVPTAYIDVFGSAEEAFEKFTGIAKEHIVNYSLDQEYFSDWSTY